MDVKIITRTEEEIEECDYRDALHIYIDGEVVFKVNDGEPEDSNMSRDFSAVYGIGELLALAHKAGEEGETFTLTLDESADI